MRERELLGPFACPVRVRSEIVLVWPDHGHNPVRERVAGIGHVVRPLVLLDRPVRGGPTLTLLVLLADKANPGADGFFNPVATSDQGEAATLGDESPGLPGHEHIIAVVIDPDLHCSLLVPG